MVGEKTKESEEMEEKKDSPPNLLKQARGIKIINGKRDDYADLVPEFAEVCKSAFDSYQELGSRKLEIVSIYSDSRSGFYCTIGEDGAIMSKSFKEEPGPQKIRVRQRAFMGLQVEAGTMTRGVARKSASLKSSKTAAVPKPFEITRRKLGELLEAVIPSAQDEGDKNQQKIDEGKLELFPLFVGFPEINIVADDTEPDPNKDMIEDLVAHARGELADKLGPKAKKITVEFIKITEHMLYADNLGNQTDSIYPRPNSIIQVETKAGNKAFGAIRGSGGPIRKVLARYTESDKPEDLEPKAIISKLADEIVKEAVDLDRAQPVSIIGASECPVIFSSPVTGVFTHECTGHPLETDIMCDNRKKKDAGVNLKSRINTQIFDYPVCIIDTPEKDFKIGEKLIRYSWGALPVDVYGTAGKRVLLVEKGTLVGVMCDSDNIREITHRLKDPSRILKLGATGNVRREKFDNDPLDRMRGTFLLPDENGPSSLEEMAKLIPPTKKGIYVKTCNGGAVNPDSGDFWINGNLCYLIENGIVTNKPIKGVVVSGNIKNVSFIKMVGNSKTVGNTFTGWCGKDGQSVPVEAGGPIVYIESAKLGGGSYYITWEDIVKDWQKQHQQVKQGVRGAGGIYLWGLKDMVPADEPHDKICVVSAVLPEGEEAKYLFGRDNLCTHEFNDKGRLIQRKDRYD